MCRFAESIAVSVRKDSAPLYGTDVDAKERSRLTNAAKTTPTKSDCQSLPMRPSAAAHEKNGEIGASKMSKTVKADDVNPLFYSLGPLYLDFLLIIGSIGICTCYIVRWYIQIFIRSSALPRKVQKIWNHPTLQLRSATCGWRPVEHFSRCKRGRCRGRFSNRISTNCQRYRCWNQEEETQLTNAGEEGEHRSVEIGVQKFSDDEDSNEYEYEDEDEDVETCKGLPAGEATTAFCKKRENSSCRKCVRGEEMQTISEEDLVSPDDRNCFETIADSTMLRETSGCEETRRISERKPRFLHSRALNRANFKGVGKKLPRYPVGCARHKCSRCSRHSSYNHGVRSVVADYLESLIAAIRPKEICRAIQPCCTPGPDRYPSNCNEVSLDAFRPPKRRPTAPSSILWKAATAVYAISGLLKDGLVKLLPQDEESQRPSSAYVNGHGDELGEQLANCANCTQRTAVDNNHKTWAGTSAANRTKEPTDGITNQRWSTSHKISTGNSYCADERGEFVTSRDEEGPLKNATASDCMSANCTAKKRRHSFIPKSTTTSGSSVTSLSSFSSIRDSCHAVDAEREEKKTENHPCRQESSVDHEIALAAESTIIDTTTSIKGNLTLSSTTICVKRSTSHTEDFVTSDDDGIDARSLIYSSNSQLAEVGNMPDGDELCTDTDEADDVFHPSCSSVLVESGEIYEIRDLEKSTRPVVKRPQYSDRSKRCQLVQERTAGRECFPICLRDGSSLSYRDEIYCSSEKASDPDNSATSSNPDYDLIVRPRRKFKLSDERAGQKSSRLNCQESELVRRNYAVKEITSETDCKMELLQPRETLIHSYLEYFKEVELADVPLEPATHGPPSSRIPRFVRHGYVEAGHKPGASNVSRRKCHGAESSCASGESRQWSQKLPACSSRWHKKIRSSSGADPRSLNSTSHHFYA